MGTEEVQELAKRFKGASHKETLTNVLEWEDRNIIFWFERYPLVPALIALSPILLVASVSFVINLQRLNNPIVTYFFVITSTIYATIFSITYLMLSYYRKIPIKEMFNVAKFSLPIRFFLKRRLGVCRDYAKFTACLLSNIYQGSEIYFATTRTHSATGIRIENKVYMLDQHLPILTIDKWHILNPSKRKIGILKQNSLKFMDIGSLLSKSAMTEIDAVKLAKEMTELLNINPQAYDEVRYSSVEIRRQKGVKRYEDDEIVNYSLARWLKMKLANEILEPNQITNIEVAQDKEDLIFIISFK
jgi:predicted transglutaminase-like protease